VDRGEMATGSDSERRVFKEAIQEEGIYWTELHTCIYLTEKGDGKKNHVFGFSIFLFPNATILI